jgi:N utilization substance protein B
MNKTISRHNARRYALQALYQWNFTQDDPIHLVKQFFDEHLLEDTDVDYFNRLVTETVKHQEQLDELMCAHLDRKLTALNPVELAILRLAMYELSYCLEIPYKVVIDEALELAKEFGAQEGHKYVNAVLDAAAKKLRKHEK